MPKLGKVNLFIYNSFTFKNGNDNYCVMVMDEAKYSLDYYMRN